MLVQKTFKIWQSFFKYQSLMSGIIFWGHSVVTALICGSSQWTCDTNTN